MEKYAPKFSKVLMTPDPHYVPGYTGYCPQLKYNMGKSYGQLTAELLTSPEVKHSNRLVLHTGHVPSTESDASLTLRSIPDSNLKKMIPGYTGFIPKSQNYFACSYAETSRKALSEFYQDQRQSTHLPDVVNYTNQQPRPPLTAISNKVITYRPLKSFTSTEKPYFMDDDNPHKYFISGLKPPAINLLLFSAEQAAYSGVLRGWKCNLMYFIGFTGHVPKSRSFRQSHKTIIHFNEMITGKIKL
uniref:Ciliary microtubule inner protein 2B n=1 Tax=Sander lucioperca TaxID=283035 RepID=A0A8D0AFA1_SANLU